MEQHLLVDEQEVSHQAQRRRHSGSDGDVTLKEVLTGKKRQQEGKKGVWEDIWVLNAARYSAYGESQRRCPPHCTAAHVAKLLGTPGSRNKPPGLFHPAMMLGYFTKLGTQQTWKQKWSRKYLP